MGPEYKTSYLMLSQREAEKRLGFNLRTFDRHAISVTQMLAIANQEAKVQGLTGEEVEEAKETVYGRIVEYLEGEGYPSEMNEGYKEVNVNDLVFAVLIPVISMFKKKTGRILYLKREKAILVKDGEMSRNQQFVMIDLAGLDHQNLVFVVEAKNESLGEAKKLCLVTMKDIGELNGGGLVYGFATTGEVWQMLRFDGTTFTQSESFSLLFREMTKNKQSWMQEGSVVVDCIHATLRSGGYIVK